MNREQENATQPEPRIRIDIDKIPQMQAERLGRAVYNATLMWQKKQENRRGLLDREDPDLGE